MSLTGENITFLRSHPTFALAQHSLHEFTRQAWHVLEPEMPFTDGWAVGAIAEHLQAVTDGQITRLLINVPPGCTKSMLTNVMWPAWEWGPFGTPSMRYISAGYEQGLAIRDLVRCRKLLRSQWYQERWPIAFQDDQDQKTYYENTSTGWRLASSVRASLVGYRGDRIIIDDPHSMMTAESDIVRNEALRWFTETVPTRLNKLDESAIVVIMQRLHERDISGLILEKLADEYTHLCLPMDYESNRHCKTTVVMPDNSTFTDPRTKDDELLWPERFPGNAVKDLKKAQSAHGGNYAIACQLQQRPAIRGGGLFKRAHFKVWDGPLPEPRRRTRGWDLAASKGSRSAYTAGVLMSQLTDGRLIIEDVVRDKLGPLEVEDLILSCADADKCRLSVPQDPGAAGVTAKAHMAKKLGGHCVVFSPETGDKDFRAGPLAAQVEAGMVYLHPGSWNAVFLGEAASFGPGASFKDQIDAASRAYADLLKHPGQSIAMVAPELRIG